MIQKLKNVFQWLWYIIVVIFVFTVAPVITGAFFAVLVSLIVYGWNLVW